MDSVKSLISLEFKNSLAAFEFLNLCPDDIVPIDFSYHAPERFLVLLLEEKIKLEKIWKKSLTQKAKLKDSCFIHNVHESLLKALYGLKKPILREMLGIVEFKTLSRCLLTAQQLAILDGVELIEIIAGKNKDTVCTVYFTMNNASLSQVNKLLKSNRKKVILPKINKPIRQYFQLE